MLVVIGAEAFIVDVVAVMEFLLTDEGHEVERKEGREVESCVLGPEEQGDVHRFQGLVVMPPQLKEAGELVADADLEGKAPGLLDWEVLQ